MVKRIEYEHSKQGVVEDLGKTEYESNFGQEGKPMEKLIRFKFYLKGEPNIPYSYSRNAKFPDLFKKGDRIQFKYNINQKGDMIYYNVGSGTISVWEEEQSTNDNITVKEEVTITKKEIPTGDFIGECPGCKGKLRFRRVQEL